MKKQMLFLIALVLALTTCFTAAAEFESTPPLNEISSNPDMAYYTWYSEVYSLNSLEEVDPNIIFTNSSISKTSSTSVTVSGQCDTNCTADEIWMELCVQQWKNNKWNDYSVSYAIDFNTSSFYSSKSVTVESGYYYRLKATYLANFHTIHRTLCGYTKSVLVN